MNWKPDFMTPETCVFLPAGQPGDPRTWCEERAAKLLPPPATDRQRTALADNLREGTLQARERTPMLAGVLYYPDCTRIPPIARIEVQGFYPKSTYEPVTLDLFRETLGTPGKHTLGDIQVTELTLPAGPALRFHEKFEARHHPLGNWYESQRITYALRPESIEDGLWLSIVWMEPAFSEPLTKMAEGMAQSLKITITGE